MAIAEALMTAKEFAPRGDPGHPEELVRGRVVALPRPNRRHGQVCAKAVRILANFSEEHDLGHVLSNDAGVITENDPDTVRGPDVAVRSPSDRRAKVLAKVAEYLEAGVVGVGVLDPEDESARLFHADGAVLMLSKDEELTVPEVLGDFRVPVRRFFA